MKKILVVLNPSAGTAPDRIESVHYLAKWYAAQVVTPHGVQELSHRISSALDQGIRRIVVAGGDGTISRVVNALAPALPHVELGIAPMGTGNDLSRSLDLPLDDVEAAFELAVSHPSIPIDLIRIQHDDRHEYFVNAATAGFGAEVTASLTPEDKQLWGAFAYWLTATTHLASMHQYQVDLLVDGVPLQGSAYGLTFANGRYIGAGVPVAGSALLDDGRLNIVLIPVASNVELLSGLVNYLMSRESTSIVTRTARQVQIRSEPPLWFSLDGEPIRLLEATIEVAPKAVQVVAGQRPAVVGT